MMYSARNAFSSPSWRLRAVMSALTACLAAIMAFGLPLGAEAAALRGKPFVYDAKQMQLPDLLRDFAGAVGVPIVIADGVAGTVNAKFSMEPSVFLDLVSRTFGLIWYYDGSAVYVYPSSRVQSRLFKLTGRLAEAPEATLGAFGLLDSRYPVKFIYGRGRTLAWTFGPPRHLELLEALIASLGGEDTEQEPVAVRAFSLTFASAVDRTVQGVLMPGVATTLTNFLGQRTDSSFAGRAQDAMGSASSNTAELLNSVQGSPESRARRDKAFRDLPNSLFSGQSAQAVTPNTPASPPLYTPPPSGDTAQVRQHSAQVTIVGDESTNLVLVRAPREQMADIERLIAKLDVPRDMVEVEATIIDISTDEMQALGFDWQFNSNRSVGQATLSPATATSTSSGAIPQGGGFNITTLLSAGGSQLLARIRALEARGTARVVSQPKVLGAANRTAVLSDKRTASVRVAGNQDAKLYSVETGTTLQVTPRLIRGAQETRIGMELVIEDGGFSSDAVDGVPIAQRTTISTDATLTEGQALLVGGIVVEGASNGRSGIPILSKLPVIGAAFRFDSSQSSRRQRLFLITPKRVQIDVAAAASAPVASRPSALNPSLSDELPQPKFDRN